MLIVDVVAVKVLDVFMGEGGGGERICRLGNSHV